MLSTRLILRALLFTKCGSYVNTARVNPSVLRVFNDRLRIDDTRAMASCIMTGTVTESFLVESAEAGPAHSLFPIHKLSIAPFEQDFRQDTAVWGLKFEFLVMPGTISPAGFSFTTRRAGKGEPWRSRKCFSSIVQCPVSCSSVSVCSDFSCKERIEWIEDGFVLTAY